MTDEQIDFLWRIVRDAKRWKMARKYKYVTDLEKRAIDAAIAKGAEKMAKSGKQAGCDCGPTCEDKGGACRYVENSDKQEVAPKLLDLMRQESSHEIGAGGIAESDKQEAEITQLIDERDSFEHMGTVLANRVSELLGVDVGEWTSNNNPIFRAIHAIEDRQESDKLEVVAWAVFSKNGYAKYVTTDAEEADRWVKEWADVRPLYAFDKDSK
ncbi:hypothetical protein [Caballeronia sp. LZ001]|uniref:hypothetical protein n=1 Tax=Caballeronia sp. LZ001 TaxID=3038553 RepID=UPI002859CCBC|nr:hypothetical protein [Caballeronia sp. LZ001]MDR5802175.1 hypothetical protein [Caballeronia sp. LZ001]